MKFKEYLDAKNISMSQASQEIGCNYEDVRRYCNGDVIPGAARMKEIRKWSGGLVTANDFYDISDFS